MGCGNTKQHNTRSEDPPKPEKPTFKSPPASEPVKSVTEPAVRGNAGSPRPSSLPDILPSREKAWSTHKIAVSGDLLVVAYSHITDTKGLTFVCHRISAGVTYSTALTDEDIAKLKESLYKSEHEWSTFWKALNTAMSKSSLISFSTETNNLDLKMKGDSKSKLILRIPLEKEGQPRNKLLYKHYFRLYPTIRALRAESIKERGLKEADYVNKETDIALSESILAAGDEAERQLKDLLPELREAAKKAKRAVGKQEGKMAKMRQEQARLDGVVPSHPLDTMYAAAAPPPAALSEKNLEELTWCTNVIEENLQLADVAVGLFHQYDLVNRFGLDPVVLEGYWSTIDKMGSSRGNPYHCSQQSCQMLCCMHFMIQKLRTVLHLSHEDILACLLAAGIYNVGHEGVDDNFIKRAQGALSMLYSDLYANNQNNCTVGFELMENHHLNILSTLNTDQLKDVTETVRECIVIKSNAQMAAFPERISDFAALVTSEEPDWTNKDNLRVALTHVVQLCHWNSWAQPPNLQKQWTDRLRDEFYNQGQRELALGLSPSNFPGTGWSTDAARHDEDFARGQVAIIDSIVLPLANNFANISPELDNLPKWASATKQAYEAEGGSESASASFALQYMGRIYRDLGNAMLTCRPGPEGMSLWATVVDEAGVGYSEKFADAALAKKDTTLRDVIKMLDGGSPLAVSSKDDEGLTLLLNETISLHIPVSTSDVVGMVLSELVSSTELRQLDRSKDVDRRVNEIKHKATVSGNKAVTLESEEKALRGCIQFCNEKVEMGKAALEAIENEVRNKGGDPRKKLEIEDALAIKVRNPLKSPLPPGVLKPPDCKEIDDELFRLLKSRYMSSSGGAKAEPKEEDKYCAVIQPYLSSEFSQVTRSIEDAKRQQIYDLLSKLDDWDFDVFTLQTAMSGGISGECLREQPHGGSLFVTMYALMFKWQFMQKFNINEQTLINWLSIVEAGYHPNPYHNSMHAADVLHVTHYILGRGGCKAKVKATDEEVFAALFAAAIHDYNHPGINNAFHVRSQNYLAVLFNDRSVNENIHASSVFELMRMDEFNILADFDATSYSRIREDIVEFVLGTDMGLHSMFLGKFKKRLETSDRVKMDHSKEDRNLTLTMAIKMADISNCGRPKDLYHRWCNVIVDEFFQQGDRERLLGMPISPFMDRYTTVMSKGQIGFMNYIVMPLFECMGEFLEHMQMATSIVDDNKGFWQEHEDW